MTFNSLTFILFFIAMLAFSRFPFSWTGRKTALLLGSWLFYMAWNPPFVVILWISTLADWHIARRIWVTQDRGNRRILLGASLLINLGMLGYFKYGMFFQENIDSLFLFAGLGNIGPVSRIILPMGISFYTFQTLSYTLDVYRRTLEPSDSFPDYALFVTFFPQLVAGPIVRASEFLPQCRNAPDVSAEQIGRGLYLFLLGLFQKTVLADGVLAPVADQVYSAPYALSSADAWIGTLAFSGQIFFDFSGYSLCAIGTALCLGFTLPDNFQSPYGASGFSDFWRRWHMSLSRWIRDYLYISLGGNRRGPFRSAWNLMLTMLLAGLWHGAAWTFVVWGGLHGFYLIAEHLLRQKFGDHPVFRTTAARCLIIAITWAGVCLAWVFFRARNMKEAFHIIWLMIFPSGGLQQVGMTAACQVGCVIGLLFLVHTILANSSIPAEKMVKFPWWGRSAVMAAMILIIILMPGSQHSFIYFQF